jgi:predicted nucleic-acid-binding protein
MVGRVRAIDTNVLVRLMVRDDPRQAEAADRFIENGAWVGVVVLAEAVWVFGGLYQRGAEMVAAAIEQLLEHKHLIFQDAEAIRDALTLFRLRPALGFSDCLILCLANKAGHGPLGTFDRALGKVEGVQNLRELR